MDVDTADPIQAGDRARKVIGSPVLHPLNLGQSL